MSEKATLEVLYSGRPFQMDCQMGTLPVGGVPYIAVVRPAVNLAVLEDARIEGVRRCCDTVCDAGGIVDFEALILSPKSALLQIQVRARQLKGYRVDKPLQPAPSAGLGGSRRQRWVRGRLPLATRDSSPSCS